MLLSRVPRHRGFHAVIQGPLNGLSYASRSSRLASTAAKPPEKPNGSGFKVKKIPYIAGGTTVAILGLLWTGQSDSDASEDLRDKEALSSVPLTKLFSGWM